MTGLARRFRARYGGSPLSLLVLVATFALGGYAAWFLVGERPVAAIVWFALAVIGHDLILLPVYSLLGRAAAGLADRTRPPVPWINYVRFPAVISGILLIVFLPAIGAFSTSTVTYLTTLDTRGYLATWLGIVGVLFLLSALSYAVALIRSARRREDQPS